MSSVKKYVIDYCRASNCPVQESIDRHRMNDGSEQDIRLIKHAHCVRCDIWRLRKFLEAQGVRIVGPEDEDSKGLY